MFQAELVTWIFDFIIVKFEVFVMTFMMTKLYTVHTL